MYEFKYEFKITYISFPNIAAETQEEKDFKQRFFRKGRVNNWKDSFKAETIEELDRWIDHNLEGTDIQMPLH